MSNQTSDEIMNQSSGQDTEEESVDSRGIPGWDRVDKLPRFLLSFRDYNTQD